MPVALLALPVLFFAAAQALGVDVNEGLWLSPPARQASGASAFHLYVDCFANSENNTY